MKAKRRPAEFSSRVTRWRSFAAPAGVGVYVTLQPLAALAFGAPPAWIATTLLLSFSIFYACASFRRVSGRMWFAGVATFLVLLGNGMLGASYYLQATGFNRVYFEHLNANTTAALPVYGKEATAAFVYLVVGTLLSVLAARAMRSRSFSWAMPGMVIVSLTLFTPVRQAAEFWLRGQHHGNESYDLSEVLAADRRSARTQNGRLKNLVLVYMEGLEQSYLGVPGLMPRLTELRRGMTRFSNVHDLMGSTIGGLVSTLCGWPFLPNPGFYRDEQFFPGMRCLGDDLLERNYLSVFMGGADLFFTRKDTLFGNHGFYKVLGAKELLPKTANTTYRNKWGLHDDSLFDLAKDQLRALSRSGSPFALVLLTVGTHVPGYVGNSCPHYGGSDNVLLQAVHCTDMLVGDFVDFIRASELSNDTVIAIVSDHLMWKGIRSQGLTTPEEDRRMTFLLDRPGEPGREIDVAGSGFDVGPTISAALGLESNRSLGLGSSLLSGPGFMWTPESGLGNKDSISDFIRSDEMRAHVNAYRPSTPAQ